jgi:hypothetical protein
MEEVAKAEARVQAAVSLSLRSQHDQLVQHSKKLPHFMEPKYSIPCSQQQVICPYPHCDKSNHVPILLLQELRISILSVPPTSN